MRILLITDEEWNDAVLGNNVLTNWFKGFNAEFAQIYCSPGMPFNDVCHYYFQVTDMQMVRSLYTGKRAGHIIEKPNEALDIEKSKQNVKRSGYYLWLKRLSLYINTPMVILRDAIWSFGRYNKNELKEFIVHFQPDIVYCPRMFTPKLMRLETIVSKMTNAPFVAFTADNEASLNCYSWSPLFWLRRLYIHHVFKKHIVLYRHYFMFSEEQAHEYHEQFGISTSCLYKSGQFTESFIPKKVGKPIRMVYAGRLYCNRWKTLAAIGDVLERLNRHEVKIVLDVYTAEALTKKQEKRLRGYSFLYVHPAITPSQLAEEYRKADIALHVESFDKGYRAATHYSFSTKIIDLMASTCAIMAICWNQHAGYKYLKENDAAICVPDFSQLEVALQQIVDTPDMIKEYAHKAWLCGRKNHLKSNIQNQIITEFSKIIES